ncbi:hypothetical protein ACJJTC_000538 [Scirpophaga incertulas]
MVRSGRDRERDRDRRRSHSRSLTPDRKRRRSRSRSRDRSSKSSKRKRSRSRDRDSKRDRSRERDRDRDRDRDRKSDRKDDKKNGSSSKSSRKKSPEKARSKSKEKSIKTELSDYDLGSADKEEEQSRLEAEMQKRRDRIERWRAERKRKEIESAKKEVQKGSIVSNIQVPAVKKWSLEDDSGDEGEDGESKEKQNSEEKKEEEDEIDPLDAYMQEVQQEVRKVNQIDQSRGVINMPTTGGTGVVILTGTAKKKVTETKNKGELIEQNQDGLEYSSEEETEDIKDAAANLASKQRKELAKVDHASLKYMPFRKAFYTEPWVPRTIGDSKHLPSTTQTFCLLNYHIKINYVARHRHIVFLFLECKPD